MIEKNQIVAYIMITPFLVSAAFNFLPPWLSVPIGVLGSMIWFGSLMMLWDMQDD